MTVLSDNRWRKDIVKKKKKETVRNYARLSHHDLLQSLQTGGNNIILVTLEKRTNSSPARYTPLAGVLSQGSLEEE